MFTRPAPSRALKSDENGYGDTMPCSVTHIHGAETEADIMMFRILGLETLPESPHHDLGTDFGPVDPRNGLQASFRLS
jgi:hypothetical protein